MVAWGRSTRVQTRYVGVVTETHPDSIGPYRVLRPLARGGMAAVYEVEDTETGHRVALKLLTQRGMARPRFQREYRALTRMDHPHIVRVYRFGVDEEGRPYLTMELLDGQPAQVYAKSLGRPGTPVRTMQVLRIATEIAGALGYLHDRGIVHRDLKSANIMVLPSGTARLLDFGTARWLVTDEQLTRHGEFVGTFAYAPPEQLTGLAVDARSDLYSLGVLIYRLLTGKRPFDADSPKELARLHLEHVPPPPGALVAGVPQAVSALTMQLLSKDREERPSSAWIVRDRLESALEAGAAAPTESEKRPPELFGRQAEVSTLQAFLAARGPGSLLLVSGPPGSGRERFLLHATQRAEELQHRVLEGTFAGPSGLTALGDIGRQAGRGLALDPIAAEALQRVSQAAAAVHRPRGRVALGQAWARLLSVRSQRDGAPVVVLLRQLHRADTAALETLRAARDLLSEEGFPVLFVGSCSRPALASLRPLAKALHPDETLSIGPVRREDMSRLVSAVLGHRSPPLGIASLVYEACGGLPGLAVAVLNAMVREGQLARTEDEEGRQVWVDCSGGRVAVPSHIAESLNLRFSALETGPRRVAEALAVAGQPVGREALAKACQLALQDADEALAQLEHAGLAEPDAVKRWTLPLGIAEQVLREGLRDSKRRVLRTELARALRDSPPTAAKVRLLLDAGDVERALNEGVRWGEGAVSGEVSAGTVALLSRIVSACSDDSTLNRRQRAELLSLYGRAATRADGSDPRGPRALDAAQDLEESSVLAMVDIERAAHHRVQGEQTSARACLQRARERLSVEPSAVLEARLHEEQAWLREACGDSLGALANWRAAQRSAGVSGSTLRFKVGAARCMAGAGQVRAAHSECESVWSARAGEARGLESSDAALQLSALLRLQARFSEAQGVVEPLGPSPCGWRAEAAGAPSHRACPGPDGPASPRRGPGASVGSSDAWGHPHPPEAGCPARPGAGPAGAAQRCARACG